MNIFYQTLLWQLSAIHPAGLQVEALQVPLQERDSLEPLPPPAAKGTAVKFNVPGGSLFATQTAEIVTKQAQFVKCQPHRSQLALFQALGSGSSNCA